MKFLILPAFLLLAAFVQRADAHAFLDHSEPAVGSVAKTPPKEVKLHFTEKLEPLLSTAQVFSAEGKPVPSQSLHTDPNDPFLLMVSLPQLRPGRYKVLWHAVSVDTHSTKGNFTFEVRPP